MKKRSFIILAALFFTVLSGTGQAFTQSNYLNPPIRNPIGPATIPQSSYRSGLFPTPNPIDTTGNLVITGNVASGKHFQGIVPYNSTSNFAGTTNSTTLDSFLRRSASSGSIANLPGRYNPYYSPSNTVTTMRPGLRSAVRPPTSQITGQSGEVASVPAVPQEQTLVRPEMSSIGTRYWPMRFKPQHLEKLILDGTLTYAEAKRLADEQNLAQMERLKQDFEQLQHRAPPLKQSQMVRDESLRPFNKFVKAKDTLQPPQLLKIQEQEKQLDPIREKGIWPEKDKLISLQTQEQAGETGEKKQGIRELDVYEQMKQEIESVRKTLESMSLGGEFESDEEDVEGKEEPEDEKTSSEKVRRQRKTLPREEEIDTWEAELEKQIISIRPREELTGLALSVRAKSIMGEHKTFASYSKDKFNQYMQAAEQYLKEGKYYRAADSYTFASIYKRNDPLAYAGKSHALFAAGGYMSSALFLSRALEIFPEYARFKVDLVGMVGDRDKVESRIADIKLWIEKSGSAELQFLLGYVYYQIGRVDEAKKAIDAAYEKMPDRPAVKTLKKAIDSAASGNQSPD